MPKQVIVPFAGRNYTIKEKPMGAAAIWRAHLRDSQVMAIFESLDVALNQFSAMALRIDESVPLEDEDGNPILNESGKAIMVKRGISFDDIGQIFGVAKIAPVIVNGLANSIDEMVAMLFDYSPELEADQEWITENAYDTEAIGAFVEVLKLCFPILAVWGLLAGPQAAQTKPSLPTHNGASGQKQVSHRKTA